MLNHTFYLHIQRPRQQDTFEPEWKDQVFDLLVADPATAELEIAVKDEHRVGKSVLLGKGAKALADMGGEKWTGWVELQVRRS